MIATNYVLEKVDRGDPQCVGGRGVKASYMGSIVTKVLVHSWAGPPQIQKGSRWARRSRDGLQSKGWVAGSRWP